MAKYTDFFATYKMTEPPEIIKDNLENLQIDNNIENYNPILKSSIFQTQLEEVIREEEPIKPQQNSKKPSKVKVKKEVPKLKGSEEFEQAFNNIVAQNPEYAKYKDFLTRTAKRESGFKKDIINKIGAKGYFQMLDSTRKSVSNTSESEFLNNPEEQIRAAIKLYDAFLSESKRLGIYDLAKSKGYSEQSIVAGAWLGGIGGVAKFLKGISNPSDSHIWNNKGGTSVGALMKQFNNV